MPLITATIGAYPKPTSVPILDWFAKDNMTTSRPTERYETTLREMGANAEAIFLTGAREAIADQVEAGIDIVTDGEVRRENYIHYHCRHLTGFDFSTLVTKSLREGAYEADLPRIVGPVAAKAPFLPHDWRAAQSCTDRPVKTTLPGPMTIADTTVDAFYGDAKALGRAIAEALNKEVLALAEAGCRHIQIDEPLFARRPQDALDFGLEHIERCWHGVGPGVTKTMHMCCGYPNYLDDCDYPKADPAAYFALAKAVDDSLLDAVSLEDAHRHNDLRLLELFQNTTVILGVVAIAKSRVEPVEEIRARLQAALQHLPPERLIAAPDCGLGHLTRDLARAKLRALSAAAKSV